MKLQDTAGATVANDLNLVAGAWECPVKHAKGTRFCKESSTTSPTAAFLDLLARRDDLKKFCDALASKNYFIPGLPAKLKSLQKKLAVREKVNATAKQLQKVETYKTLPLWIGMY